MDLAVSQWRNGGDEVLRVSDAGTEQEVGRYVRRTGRLAVGDRERAYEVVEALWAFLAGGTQAEEVEGCDIDVLSEQLLPPLPPLPEPESLPAPEPAPVSETEDALPPVSAPQAPASAPPQTSKAKSVRLIDRRLGRLRRDGWVLLSEVGKQSIVDFDRLLIGPAGVFALTVAPGGEAPASYPVESLQESQRAAEAAARRLSDATGLHVKATLLLAVVGTGAHVAAEAPASHVCEAWPQDVLVARGEDVVEVLRDLPAVYSLQERQQILDTARRADLWRAA